MQIQQEMQAPAISSEFARMKLEFLAGLNHEIRTPLTGILGMADLLMETQLSEEQIDYVNHTRVCAESLLESLSNALEFSALKAGQVTMSAVEFPLAEVLRNATMEHERKAEMKNLAITAILDPNMPPTAVGDAFRLRQVLGILISNAIKFTESGEVEVIASTVARVHGIINLTVSVRDTGCGIAPERIPLLFEVDETQHTGFARTSSGLGIGLPLVKKLLELMDGSVEVESGPESGTLFTVRLPLGLQLAVPENAANTPTAGKSSASSAALRVLVVEDNLVAQKFMQAILQRRGYWVSVAPSGPDAIDIVKAEAFDLILMDVQMPLMDGIEAARLIRELPNGSAVPIIACTANTSNEVRDACIVSGMNDFLPKPVQTNHLVDAIQRNLKVR